MNLMLMLVLSLMCYFFAGGYLKRLKGKNYNAALLQKTLASACFVGIGAFSLSMSWYEKFAQLVFLGLCCGAVGDVLMAVAKNKNRKLTVRSASFGVGMLVFLAGHVLYILGLADITFDVFKVGIPYAVAAVLLSLLFEKKQKVDYSCGRRLKGGIVGAVIYLFAVFLMAGCACGAAVYGFCPGTLLFAIGGLFFGLSDVILTSNSFGAYPSHNKDISLIFFYYSGQILIAFSPILLIA